LRHNAWITGLSKKNDFGDCEEVVDTGTIIDADGIEARIPSSVLIGSALDIEYLTVDG
jgi:hypothetical protein